MYLIDNLFFKTKKKTWELNRRINELERIESENVSKISFFEIMDEINRSRIHYLNGKLDELNQRLNTCEKKYKEAEENARAAVSLVDKIRKQNNKDETQINYKDLISHINRIFPEYKSSDFNEGWNYAIDYIKQYISGEKVPDGYTASELDEDNPYN